MKTARRTKEQRCMNAWRDVVFARWNNRCALCGKQAHEAHHLWSRGTPSAKYDPDNGIALCASCHRHAHDHTSLFLSWLDRNYPELAEHRRQIKANPKPQFQLDLNEVLESLLGEEA